MNPLALILLLTIGGVFAANAANAISTGNKSSIKLMNVDSLKTIGAEFEIVASIVIDNPTSKSITIKKPYLKLYYNGNDVGNSLPSTEYISVKANARTPLKVNLRIPFTSVPVLVLAAFNGKGSTQMISVEVLTTVSGFTLKDKTDYKIADLVKLLKNKNK